MFNKFVNVWLSSRLMRYLGAFALGIGGGDVLAYFGTHISSEKYGHLLRIAAFSWMLIIAIAVWLKYFSRELRVFQLRGWLMAGALAIGILLASLITGGVPVVVFTWQASFLIMLLWCVLLVGFTEELWWRGIWFEMWKGRPVMCVLGGSLLFMAYHYPFQGFEPLPMIFFMGLAFATARYRGASIVSLSVAHGAIDFVHAVGVIQWHGQSERFPQYVPVAVISVLLMALFLFPLRKSSVSPCEFPEVS
ncbi:MAG: CPBP family intramembrane metalloprotease [Elusimicrobia bacterium]|nr:CPBP family intramembrane metalloprotease [Elusimicrobiota bacterium]